MKIKDIMSKRVVIVSPDTPLHEVAQKMRGSDCGCVVVMKDDKLVGIVTDRDLAVRCVAEAHHPAETSTAEVMTPEILYCRETDEAEAVALNMTENKVRRLIVLDDHKRMVGIVTLGDLAIASRGRDICGTALADICAPDKTRPGIVANAP